MDIKRHRYMGGGGGVPQLLQNIQESHDGVGVPSVPGGQRFYAVKRPVDDAVAVDDQQIHVGSLLCLEYTLYCKG